MLRYLLLETLTWKKSKVFAFRFHTLTQIAKIIGPIWDPPGSSWPQMGHMLAPWTLLSGQILIGIASYGGKQHRSGFLFVSEWTPYITLIPAWHLMAAHQFETLYTLLAICEGNPTVNGIFPSGKASNAQLKLYLIASMNELMYNQVAGDLFMVLMWHHFDINKHTDGLVQERRNSIANALELHLSCTNPSIWYMCTQVFFSITWLNTCWFIK